MVCGMWAKLEGHVDLDEDVLDYQDERGDNNLRTHDRF